VAPSAPGAASGPGLSRESVRRKAPTPARSQAAPGLPRAMRTAMRGATALRPQDLKDAMTARIDLAAHLAALDLPQGLTQTLTVAAAACVDIKAVVAGGALVGALGASGAVNVQDEEQKKLDVIANDILTDALMACPVVAGVASEEMDTVHPATNPAGEYLVLFDPLDGSSNIDINAPVGT